MIPFQDGMPISTALNYVRIAFFKVIVVPFLFYEVMKQEPSSIKVFRNIMMVCIAVAAIYGLFLITLDGLNPYMISIMSLNDQTYNLDYALATGEGRLFGRISSVFTHPMAFGFFLVLSFLFLYKHRNNIKPYIFVFLFVIVILNVIFCGVRSAVGTVGVSIIYYLVVGRKYKLAFVVTIGFFVLPLLIDNIPGLSNYLGSIVDFEQKQTYIGGSNWETRYEQWQGCFDIIKANPLTGNGFEWTQYYYSENGNHPVLLAFESLIFVILCDSGFVGFIIWFIFLVQLFSVSRSVLDKECSLLIKCLIVAYIFYSCLTGCGITGNMSIFAIFFILLVSERQNIVK